MPFELDAADHALGEGDVFSRDVGPDRREHALHAGSRVGRAAHDLYRAGTRLDHADPEPVGVGMLFGLDDMTDDEARVFGARILDALDLEADAGQRLDDLGERGLRVEMVLEPGEGEFHRRASFLDRETNRVASWSLFAPSRISNSFTAARAAATSATASAREKETAIRGAPWLGVRLGAIVGPFSRHLQLAERSANPSDGRSERVRALRSALVQKVQRPAMLDASDREA